MFYKILTPCTEIIQHYNPACVYIQFHGAAKADLHHSFSKLGAKTTQTMCANKRLYQQTQFIQRTRRNSGSQGFLLLMNAHKCWGLTFVNYRAGVVFPALPHRLVPHACTLGLY